ncbi:diguanylate cyclase/phosphodiesterase (GGDEF & EAL domains) with PAS/PAC sensor(s) [Euzebya pacifica]|uniref:Diguanylate cyclase/phosphodiesterase (GGDEF & EAL domains) with PAS/PAC sensor(S) n=2 Tax=Euzebya pacifica TaxID=1608957 RepID=A0A346Y149_9ACTN|nr:diguanylate cyclase/phosphodiesterase (GGDEF & EAL domains) with PAS/PAC sensor(s) [Euzebya pacifica]
MYTVLHGLLAAGVLGGHALSRGVDTLGLAGLALTMVTVVHIRRPGRLHEVLLDGIALGVLPAVLFWNLAALPALEDGRASAVLAFVWLARLVLHVITGLSVVLLAPSARHLLGARLLVLIAASLIVGDLVMLAGWGLQPPPTIVLLLVNTGGVAVGAAVLAMPSLGQLIRPGQPELPASGAWRIAVAVAAVALGSLLMALNGGAMESRAVHAVLVSLGVGAIGLRSVQALRRTAAHAAERMAAQEELARLGRIDQLTGLANRTTLESHLRAVLGQRMQDGKQLATYLLDLDGFKAINDQHGHAAGDDILGSVARALTDVVGDRGMAARLGGDEFVVVLDEVGDELEAVEMGHRLVEAIAAVPGPPSSNLSVGASVGVELSHGHVVEPRVLLGRADAAMYRAKRGELDVVVNNSAADPVVMPDIALELRLS